MYSLWSWDQHRFDPHKKLFEMRPTVIQLLTFGGVLGSGTHAVQSDVHLIITMEFQYLKFVLRKQSWKQPCCPSIVCLLMQSLVAFWHHQSFYCKPGHHSSEIKSPDNMIAFLRNCLKKRGGRPAECSGWFLAPWHSCCGCIAWTASSEGSHCRVCTVPTR